MIDWSKQTTEQIADRAGRRAAEAISRVGTLNTDVTALSERVSTLEALCGELLDVVEALLRDRTA